MKAPSFQFYPGDWRRDAALQSCSVGARGLWIEMLCLMHEGYPYGYLKVGSKVILPPNLALMVGATLPDVEGWLAELSAVGVFSVDKSGAMFSRRMLRDQQLRQVRAAGGVKGGNPTLKVNHKVANKVNLQANLQPTPASALAIASASTEEESTRASCEVPSWEEFWSYCQIIGMPSEWYARDKFLAAETDNWDRKGNWKSYVARFKAWWEAEGRPMQPPSVKIASDGRPAKPSEFHIWRDGRWVDKRRIGPNI